MGKISECCFASSIQIVMNLFSRLPSDSIRGCVPTKEERSVTRKFWWCEIGRKSDFWLLRPLPSHNTAPALPHNAPAHPHYCPCPPAATTDWPCIRPCFVAFREIKDTLVLVEKFWTNPIKKSKQKHVIYQRQNTIKRLRIYSFDPIFHSVSIKANFTPAVRIFIS